jgi:hypothetical protein
LLGTGEPDLGRLVKIFQDICTVSVEDDGITFDSTSSPLRFLARTFEFEGPLLTKALTATFARRGTSIPIDDPVAFTKTLTEDPQKKAQ